MIDAGGFTGDSLESALKCRKTIKPYVGFEPDLRNFSGLVRIVHHNRACSESVDLYRCAIGNKNQVVSFECEGNVSSMVSASGTGLTPMVRIDDIIYRAGEAYHMLIKMDVEGSELEALQGAKETIRVYKPDLMICVYHKITDIWEIPIYLHSLVQNINLICVVLL